MYLHPDDSNLLLLKPIASYSPDPSLQLDSRDIEPLKTTQGSLTFGEADLAWERLARFLQFPSDVSLIAET